ncbi:MAG: hypothetical protein J7599_07450 [Niabella sp.]|nr:hypothetical protein [Niabella sp.]
MKKAIKILVMSAMVACLYTLAMLIGTSFPPRDGFTQVIPGKSDSLTLDEAKDLLKKAEQNNQVAAAMEAVKPEKQIIVKERKVYVPVEPRRQSVAASKPAELKPKAPVTVIFEAPKYSGTQVRDKMTYAEWKMQRGLLQSKSYRIYEKYLNDDK